MPGILAAFVVLTVAQIAAVTTAHANEPQCNSTVPSTIERLRAAYGSHRLEELASVSIESDRRVAWPGQGQTSSFVEFATERIETYLDLHNGRGSHESWVAQNGNIYHQRLILVDQKTISIDYGQMSFREAPPDELIATFGSAFRSSDLLLAYWLRGADVKQLQHTRQFYAGQHNDILTFSMTEEGPAVSAYVSCGSGLIHRVRMDREFGEVNLIFTGHRQTMGIRHATEVHGYIDDRLIEFERGIRVTPNASAGGRLHADVNLTPDPVRVDQSGMTVQLLAPDVYLVGEEDYSLFVAHDDGFIAVNPYAGLNDRFDALRESLGVSNPLTDVIATHHHSDHLADVSVAYTDGRRLWLTPQTLVWLRKNQLPPADADIRVLGRDTVLGPLTIYLRGTPHASENALVLHRQSGVLFQDDHYHGLLVDQPTWVQPSAVALKSLIDELEISVSMLASGHAKKAETWTAFERAALDPQAGVACRSGRPICADVELPWARVTSRPNDGQNDATN